MSSDSKTGSVFTLLSSLSSIWVWIFETEKNSSISKSSWDSGAGQIGAGCQSQDSCQTKYSAYPVSDQEGYWKVDKMFPKSLSKSVVWVWLFVMFCTLKFKMSADILVSWFKSLGSFWGNKPQVTVLLDCCLWYCLFEHHMMSAHSKMSLQIPPWFIGTWASVGLCTPLVWVALEIPPWEQVSINSSVWAAMEEVTLELGGNGWVWTLMGRDTWESKDRPVWEQDNRKE
jgi:hypothetical protein